MPWFRKRPVDVEAQQWFSNGHCPVWAQDKVRELGDRFEVATLEGCMTGIPGDWIIKGVKGEIYPCKPDIFEATYQPVGVGAIY